MCIEDVKIGKASQGKMLPFVGSGASQLVLPQDNNRRGVILGAPDVGMVTYCQGGPAVLGQGYNLAPNSNALNLDGDLWGSCVRDPWYAIVDTAGRQFAVGYVHFNREDMQ